MESDPFLAAAIEEATTGWDEGGIPIGSVLVHGATIIGRGHNQRVQRGRPTLHGEIDVRSIYRDGRLIRREINDPDLAPPS